MSVTTSSSDTSGMSPINRMFNGRSVFITGASGFIGRVLLEKLLRTYQGIKTIYILLRAKKNLQPSERLYKHLLDIPIFDRIKSLKNGQQLLDKIVVVTGDIGEPNLGICDEDMEKLLNDQSLSIVFHAAAMVKFDEPLKVEVQHNLIGTMSVLNLCKRLKNLVALCHLSTAFVNSHMKDGALIEEKLYPMQQEPQELINLAEYMDDGLMESIKPTLVGERPNAYTYTKALAERLVAKEAQDLPVAIVRPSIVIASWKEPIAGWIDNLNGPTGLMVAFGKGLMRSIYIPSKSNKADCIPVDIVVNMSIAAAYYAAKTKHKLDQQNPATPSKGDHETHLQSKALRGRSSSNKQPPIFHCTSGQRNPITWAAVEDMFPITRKHPSEQVLRYPCGSFKSNRYHDQVARLFFHFLPALIIDLLCIIVGREPRLLTIYFKIHRAIEALSHFTTIEYNFDSKNVSLLESCLVGRDKEELYLDISSLVYPEYGETYILGIRRYILKEPDSSLGQARRSLDRAYYIEVGLRIILVTLGLYFVGPAIIRFATHLLRARA